MTDRDIGVRDGVEGSLRDQVCRRKEEEEEEAVFIGVVNTKGEH